MKREKQTPQMNEDSNQKDSAAKNRVSSVVAKLPQKKQVKSKPVWNMRKKYPEKKATSNPAIFEYIEKARQFLRESKTELKKVKWPTKKELLASTAVVLFLSLLMALYFGIVDFGLIKIIKAVLK